MIQIGAVGVLEALKDLDVPVQSSTEMRSMPSRLPLNVVIGERTSNYRVLTGES
jgi:hypothetical protein